MILECINCCYHGDAIVACDSAVSHVTLCAAVVVCGPRFISECTYVTRSSARLNPNISMSSSVLFCCMHCCC